MAGLKIQVNGKGLIPRGYGLAPRKDPFMANDINLIGLILNTSGLSIKYVNPSNGRLEDLTKKNLKKVWDQYSNYTAPAQVAPDQGDDKAKAEEVKKVAPPKKAKEPIPKIDDIPVIHKAVTPAATEEAPKAEEAAEEATPTEEEATPEQQPTETEESKAEEAPQGQGNPNAGKIQYNGNKPNKNQNRR